MKTNTFNLRALPELQWQIGLEQRMGARNELRILRSSFRKIANLAKLQRYGEAEYLSRVLAGILRCWDMKRQEKLS